MKLYLYIYIYHYKYTCYLLMFFVNFIIYIFVYIYSYVLYIYMRYLIEVVKFIEHVTGIYVLIYTSIHVYLHTHIFSYVTYAYIYLRQADGFSTHRFFHAGWSIVHPKRPFEKGQFGHMEFLVLEKHI